VHALETPSSYSSHQQWLYPDRTREWNKRARWIRHLQKALANLWFRQQGATLANFTLCHQEIFRPKRFVVKMRAHLYRWLVATIRECIAAVWSVVIKQFECSIVTKISEGIASQKTIRFITLRQLTVSKIQRSLLQLCDVTITGSFQTSLEINICRRLQGPSQLSTPLYSQYILCIYAAMKGLGGGAKT